MRSSFAGSHSQSPSGQVKGKAPVVEDVLLTPRGPIIGPALEGDFGAISLRAVWLDARSARGFMQAHRAGSLAAFRNEFSS
jgi:penicillin amidase